jgi:hypothetical protein
MQSSSTDTDDIATTITHPIFGDVILNHPQDVRTFTPFYISNADFIDSFS